MCAWHYHPHILIHSYGYNSLRRLRDPHLHHRISSPISIIIKQSKPYSVGPLTVCCNSKQDNVWSLLEENKDVHIDSRLHPWFTQSSASFNNDSNPRSFTSMTLLLQHHPEHVHIFSTQYCSSAQYLYSMRYLVCTFSGDDPQSLQDLFYHFRYISSLLTDHSKIHSILHVPAHVIPRRVDQTQQHHPPYQSYQSYVQ